jgi:Tol biopolymer transport system component
MVYIRHTYLLVLISILFLTACTSPIAQTPELPDPTDTSVPAPTTPETPPTPSITPTQAPSPDPTAESTQSPASAPDAHWVAFIGWDQNVRLVDRNSGQLRDVTIDANPPGQTAGSEATIHYWNPKWSSDGQLLAYQRNVGQPISEGYSYTFEVWIYEVVSGQARQLLSEERVVSYAWRPGTHQLAVSFGIEDGYFNITGQLDSTKARGIWALDVDSGESVELVGPENGYSLGRPQWSRDGRYLFFDEVWNYEGTGYFTIYDFDNESYASSQESIGFYDLSPDGQTLAYDTLTYGPSGEEKVYLRPIAGGEPQQFSPEYEIGYAFFPLFSPAGDQLAYMAEVGVLDSGQYTLFVQALQEEEARSLGVFEFGYYLNWLEDGSGLILSGGPFEARQIFEVSLADGAIRVLAEGDMPALQPVNH